MVSHGVYLSAQVILTAFLSTKLVLMVYLNTKVVLMVFMSTKVIFMSSVNKCPTLSKFCCWHQLNCNMWQNWSGPCNFSVLAHLSFFCGVFPDHFPPWIPDLIKSYIEKMVKVFVHFKRKFNLVEMGFNIFLQCHNIKESYFDVSNTVNCSYTGLVWLGLRFWVRYSIRNPVYPNSRLYKTYCELFLRDWNSRSGMCEFRYNQVRYKINWLYIVALWFRLFPVQFLQKFCCCLLNKMEFGTKFLQVFRKECPAHTHLITYSQVRL